MSNTTVNPIEPKKTGSFFQDNQKSITFIVGGIVVLVLLYLGYQKLYLEPRAEKPTTPRLSGAYNSRISSMAR